MNQSAPSQPNPTGSPKPTGQKQVFERNGQFGIGTDANNAEYNYSTREAAQKALTSQQTSK